MLDEGSSEIVAIRLGLVVEPSIARTQRSTTLRRITRQDPSGGTGPARGPARSAPVGDAPRPPRLPAHESPQRTLGCASAVEPTTTSMSRPTRPQGSISATTWYRPGGRVVSKR